MIVKLSCGCSVETLYPGYTHGESLSCPDGNTVERIVAIESDRPITRNRLTGEGISVKCEDCGALFSGESTCCPSCAEDREFNSRATTYVRTRILSR